MPEVLVLLSHVRHTTFSFELSVAIANRTPFDVTVVSYYDPSVDGIEVPTDAVTVVPLGATSRFDVDAIRRLRRVLATDSSRILHTHHNFVGSLGRLLAPRGTPIVNTEHADHRDHYSPLQVLVNALTLPRADRVVANSERTLQSLYPFERRLLPEERFTVIYNGIDVERIDRALADAGPRDESPERRITTVGRMSETKNQSALVRAFAEVRERFPDCRLTLIGDGPLRDELETLADALGVRDAVEFTGFVDRDEVYRTLRSSDVYVQPSLSEGFCVATVEAMACNVPVVVSDIDVFHEVVGGAGSFADPTNPSEFADRIRRLLADDRSRAEAAANGYERARTEFSLAKTVDDYRDLYMGLLEESAAGSRGSIERVDRNGRSRESFERVDRESIGSRSAGWEMINWQ